jgi:SNF2 family DNA or RNA helicase
MQSSWCNTCRGPGETTNDLIKCRSCQKKFHLECCGGEIDSKDDLKKWVCLFCVEELEHQKENKKGKGKSRPKSASSCAKVVTSKMNKLHRNLRAKTCKFFQRERDSFSSFLSEERLDELSQSSVKEQSRMAMDNGESCGMDTDDADDDLLIIGPNESYIKAELRCYQVEGINWMLQQYNSGVGGIVADEMGLGET